MNNNSNKWNNLEKHYKEIFVILYEIIEYYENSKKSNSKNPLLDKYSLTFLSIYSMFFGYSIILIARYDFFINNINSFILLSKVFLSIIASLTIIIIRFLVEDIRKSKNYSKNSLRNTCQKGIHELEFCHKLSLFDKLALEYAENRLKLLIENRKIGEQIINNLIPFFALGLTIFTVYQYQPENTENFNFMKNIMVISGIVTIMLKAITELTDNKTIYQKCLAIVQYAKVLNAISEQDFC
ncbi:MAG: hypothetical protein QNJ37_18435 [Crocosphaera sp.]|nr:hypothetical protein [Crocosphaera sp.]